jgi:tRNA (mo5U34)-methyltransferase
MMGEFGRRDGVAMSQDEIRARISGLPWLHSIDLGQGVQTPGRWGPPSPLIMRALDTVDFKGKKVLDIGCLDGLWSFQAEQRGARTVIATDDVTQLGYEPAPTLATAREILGSRVEYRPDVSVYDVADRLSPHDFDVVLFCGVYYHLRDPLRALAMLRRMLKTGGTILVEGEALMDREHATASFFYADVLGGDASNWWVPTLRCLREWVECSFFAVRQEYLVTSDPPRRFWWRRHPQRVRVAMTAAAVERADPGYKCPDPLLQAFDLNRYPWARAR